MATNQTAGLPCVWVSPCACASALCFGLCGRRRRHRHQRLGRARYRDAVTAKHRADYVSKPACSKFQQSNLLATDLVSVLVYAFVLVLAAAFLRRAFVLVFAAALATTLSAVLLGGARLGFALAFATARRCA